MGIAVGFFHPACGLIPFKSAVLISISLCGQKISYPFSVLEFPHLTQLFCRLFFLFFRSSSAFPVGANRCSKHVGSMIQTLPVNINSFKHYSVAFIFPFPTKPFFLTSSCLPLFSSCKPFLGPASCPVKTWLLGWSFSPQRLVNLPSLAGYLSKIRCIQLRPCLTYRGWFLE